MDVFNLDQDVTVYCVRATSFPDGVLKAHQILHSFIPYDVSREYYGISAPNQTGEIIYKAAAQEAIPGELSNHQLESFVIKKGTYAYIDVHNYMNHISAIGDSFAQLISLPNIDQNGCCVEHYKSLTDVRCMVRLNNN